MNQLLTEQYLRDNIAEEIHNGTMDLLSQDDASIRVWDEDDDKEIAFYFLEKMGIKDLASRIHISKQIPDKLKIAPEELAAYLWRVCDKNAFLTMSGMYIFWDGDDEDDEIDPLRENLCNEYGDEYALYIAEDPLLGQLWRDRNFVAINASSIWKAAQEDAEENADMQIDPWFSKESSYARGVLMTAIHELRHLQLDTNPFLPEDAYPLYLAKEQEVEKYCREVYEANSCTEDCFPNL